MVQGIVCGDGHDSGELGFIFWTGSSELSVPVQYLTSDSTHAPVHQLIWDCVYIYLVGEYRYTSRDLTYFSNVGEEGADVGIGQF